jgi:hypothetical protein
MISKGFGFVAFFASVEGPKVSYHQTYSAREWLSILRTPYLTPNLQRKHRTELNFF